MKILYVEDNPRDADLAMRQLRKAAPHFQIETVTTLAQASARLKRLDTEPLDLVLTDVHLRDGDGLALLNQIRDQALSVAAVVITGTGDEEIAVAALKAGADDYVTKRKDYLDRLPLILENAVHHYRATTMRRPRPLKVLYAEHDPKDVELTRRHFSKHAGHIRIDVVSTGPEALQRLQAENGPDDYDILLLDYRLPHHDALELLKELRLIRKLDIPVVLVTGQGSEEVALQAIKLGASNYVVKNPGYLYQLPGALESANFRVELMRREQRLRASQERYELATAAAGVGVWDSGLATGQIYVDPRLKSILGYRNDEIRDHLDDWKNLVHPDDAALVMECARAHLAGKTPSCEVEHRMLHRDGTVRWFLSRGAVVKDDNGNITRMVGTSVDITERKRVEQDLQQLTARLLNLQDEERRRIARELHDQTAQNLFAVTTNVAKLQEHNVTQESEVKRILDDCQILCEQALKEVRTLSYLLHPPLLDEAGLTSALQWYIKGFAKRSGILVDVMFEEIGRLPSEAEIALFRIVQESLTNIRRHSGSSTASITLERKEHEVTLQIKDHGRGMLWQKLSAPAEQVTELGVGIHGMRQRMRQLGGRLEVASTEEGTTITASLPLKGA
jgi:PAS domain S-box-containing protein